jgi:hypothetical protein
VGFADTTTLLKVALAPVLILVATLVGRRWGPGVGGWLAGLPLTSFPVSLVLALELGPEFATRAAIGTLFGLISVAGFSVAYGSVARFGWGAGLAAGVGAFAGLTLILGELTLPLPIAFGLVCIALPVAGSALAASAESAPPAGRLPSWSLALRMAVATFVVFVLTTAAARIGPALTGSLSTAPVFGAVLAAFTQRDQGAGAAVLLLRGMVLGSFGFATFLVVVGALLVPLGLGPTYVLAAVSALLVHGLSLVALRRWI